MPQIFPNNASTRLAQNLSISATTIPCSEVASFPDLAAGEWYTITLVDAAQNREICRVTGIDRVAKTLTVTREQEGLAARTWTVGDVVQVRLTSGALSRFAQPDRDNAFSVPQSVADATQPGHAVNKRQLDGIGAASPGDIKMAAYAIAPTGWLACDGGAVSRTQYSALFAAIGTNYGAGDGVTTFNLPDTRGRFPLGVGAGAGLTARNLGDRGGAETHTLTIDEMPNHQHTMKSFDRVGATGGGNPDAFFNGDTGPTYLGETASAGGSQPHNNMPPFLGINFFIKT